MPVKRITRDQRAISPAISTVILTSAIILMLIVVLLFANNYLNAQIAANEFNAMEQFMQNVSLQIDNVAWTVGSTQTVRYASKYGQVILESGVLNSGVYSGVLSYALYVNNTNTWVANFSTAALIFNMPITAYNIVNNYSQRILPFSNSSFLQQGTSATVSQVFVIERTPMQDGSYVRIVVAPSIRMLNSTIGTANYTECYLPILQPGNSPYLSQSVTLISTKVSDTIEQNINQIKMDISFPISSLGFNSTFFGFSSTEQIISLPAGSTLNFYTGNVTVSLGLYS